MGWTARALAMATVAWGGAGWCAPALAHGGTHPTPFPTGRPSTPSSPSGGSPTYTNSIRSTRWEDWWDLHRWRFIGGDRRRPTLTGDGTATPFLETAAGQFLLEALKDKWWDTRAAACIAFGKAADPGDATRLRPRVYDEREDTRGAAMLGLALLRADLRSAEVLDVFENRKEPDKLRGFAALALGFSRDAAAVIPLSKRMLDPREEDQVRAAAALALGAVGELSAVPHLRRVLDNVNQPDTVRAMATTALGRLCGVGYARRAADPAPAPQPEPTDAAGKAAAAMLDPDFAHELLLRLLRGDRESAVRRAAVMALGRLAIPDDIPALIRAIQDPDYGVEIFAMVTVGEMAKGSKYVDQILPLLTHRATTAKYPGTRAFAALGLGLLGDHRAGPTLVQVLDSGKHLTLRGAGATALGLLGWARGAAPLMAVASTRGDPDLRAHSIVALGLIGDNTHWLAIRELLTSDKTPAAVRAAAAVALATAGAPQDVEPVAALLKENSAWLRMSALQALGYLRDDTALRHLIDHFRSESDNEVRAVCVVAVGNIVARSLPHAFQDLARDVNYLLHSPAIEQAIRLR